MKAAPDVSRMKAAPDVSRRTAAPVLLVLLLLCVCEVGVGGAQESPPSLSDVMKEVKVLRGMVHDLRGDNAGWFNAVSLGDSLIHSFTHASVRPSVHPSIHPSIHPSVHPHVLV